MRPARITVQPSGKLQIEVEGSATRYYPGSPVRLARIERGAMVVYVVASDVRSPEWIVVSADDVSSCAVLDRLPARVDDDAVDRVLAEFEALEDTEVPEAEPGRMSLVDGVFSVATSTRRWDMVVGHDRLPVVLSVDGDGDGFVVGLRMPDRTRLRLAIAGDRAEEAHRDLARVRAAATASAVGEQTRWQYRVVNIGVFRSQERMSTAFAVLGQDGWELVTIYDKASNWLGDMEKGFMLFKRPVPPGAEVDSSQWCRVMNLVGTQL